MTARRNGTGGSLRDRLVAFATPPVTAIGDASEFIFGIGWNLVGFIVYSGAGLLLNISIAGFYDAEILGIFNVVLAINGSWQFAAFGIQYSTLFHASVLIKGSEHSSCDTGRSLWCYGSLHRRLRDHLAGQYRFH